MSGDEVLFTVNHKTLFKRKMSNKINKDIILVRYRMKCNNPINIEVRLNTVHIYYLHQWNI